MDFIAWHLFESKPDINRCRQAVPPEDTSRVRIIYIHICTTYSITEYILRRGVDLGYIFLNCTFLVWWAMKCLTRVTLPSRIPHVLHHLHLLLLLGTLAGTMVTCRGLARPYRLKTHAGIRQITPKPNFKTEDSRVCSAVLTLNPRSRS